jgi:hypothetical protein
MRATRSWVRTDTTKGASSGELKVLALEATGQSSPEIVTSLHIGQTTLKHVTSWTNWGCATISHAVVHAYKTGFVEPGGTP